MKPAPRVLVVAGLEPSGRAGLLADVDAIRRLEGVPLAVASAVTAQGERDFAVDPVRPSTIAAQIASLRERGAVDAVKLGMIPNRPALAAVHASLADVEAPWVVDPVVRTSAGQTLSTLTPRDYRSLARPDVVLTPNAIEAGWLLGRPRPPRTLEDAVRAAEALCALGFGAVVVKGGHLADAPADVLATERGVDVLQARRLRRSPEQRGTGCRFASALAVALARGERVEAAVRMAKREVQSFLRGGR